jgi:hypothetical protein
VAPNVVSDAAVEILVDAAIETVESTDRLPLVMIVVGVGGAYRDDRL